MARGDPSGGRVGRCARCWSIWYCPRLGVCLLPQHSHKVYRVACFVYIKGRVFLIYSQIILIMTQICNKSHQCSLNVSTLVLLFENAFLGPPMSEPL